MGPKKKKGGKGKKGKGNGNGKGKSDDGDTGLQGEELERASKELNIVQSFITQQADVLYDIYASYSPLDIARWNSFTKDIDCRSLQCDAIFEKAKALNEIDIEQSLQPQQPQQPHLSPTEFILALCSLSWSKFSLIEDESLSSCMHVFIEEHVIPTSKTKTIAHFDEMYERSHIALQNNNDDLYALWEENEHDIRRVLNVYHSAAFAGHKHEDDVLKKMMRMISTGGIFEEGENEIESEEELTGNVNNADLEKLGEDQELVMNINIQEPLLVDFDLFKKGLAAVGFSLNTNPFMSPSIKLRSFLRDIFTVRKERMKFERTQRSTLKKKKRRTK